jgi:hypothetical protein
MKGNESIWYPCIFNNVFAWRQIFQAPEKENTTARSTFVLRQMINGCGLQVSGSNPGSREIFRTRPDRSWGQPSLPHDEYRVSFQGVKRPGRGVNHPPPYSAEVKERVELHHYSSSAPSWLVLGRPLPLLLFSTWNVCLKHVITITVALKRTVYDHSQC